MRGRSIIAVDMGGGKSSSNIVENISPTITCTHGGEPAILDIQTEVILKMENISEAILKSCGDIKEAERVIKLTEKLLGFVSEELMSVEDAVTSLREIRKRLQGNEEPMEKKGKEEMKKAAEKPTSKTENEENEEVCVVRRLTTTCTARLQGFPDDYTKIDGAETSDAPQFKAHGNSWATPCANHMSTRIEMELRRLGHKGTVNYATCCSGIEAQSVAVSNLDWKSIFFSEIDPFPCRVLEKHYPNTPNLGDMTQIHYDKEKGVISNSHKEGEEYFLPKEFREAPIIDIPFKEGDMDVFSGGTPCQSVSVAGKRAGMAEGSGTESALAWHYQRIIDECRPTFTLWENVCFGADTLVTTKEGHKRIADIEVGDKVRSLDGKYHRVEKVIETKHKDTIQLKVMGAEEIIVTPNHPFYARVDLHNKKNTSKREFTKPEWIAAGELTKDHYIGYKLDEEGTKSIGMANAYAVGRWLADGSVSLRSKETHNGARGGQRARIFISTGWKKHDSLARELARLPYKISESKIKDYAINFTFTSDEFYKFIEECGKGARNKKIPAYVYELKPEEQEELLRGYFDGDGHKHGTIEMTYGSSSRELAMGIARLVRDVYHRGVSIRHIKGKGTIEIEGRIVKAHDSWVGSFSNEIVRSSEKKHLISFVEDGFIWCPVREIANGCNTTVYNLTVADTHTYEANDIVVHNCGALSSNGGADFIAFVNRCAESGYSMAWRVLDAQYVMTEEFPRAVPQRRRRIWLVGYKGNDWRIPVRICFELTKDLTANPPKRVPGIGFKTINPDVDIESIRKESSKGSDEVKPSDLGLFDLFASDEKDSIKPLKVSKLIPFSEMPDEADFSKIPMVSIYEFAKRIGEPTYLGPIFRTDKKTAMDEFKKSEFYHEGWEWENNKEAESYLAELKEKESKGELQWQGAEIVNPRVLENIGNAGIVANGRICTLSCPEWTSGIQLSPSTYKAWEELVNHKDYLKANELLPAAYNETVCGLSDILEENPDEKYNLSWRACYGILQRAEKRGKELPNALAIALLSTIRENAGIVKWFALNGRDTKKKETDLSEREIAKICFDKYISSVLDFSEVKTEAPKKKNEEWGESDCLEDGSVEDEEGVYEEDNPINEDDEGFGSISRAREKVIKEKMPDIPNGVINREGGGTAATLVASCDTKSGTTQDANVIAVKK